jgi:hypothetical protein
MKITSLEDFYVREHTKCVSEFYGVLESDIEAKN